MSNRARLILDCSLLAGLLVVDDPALTGLVVHELLGVAIAGFLLLHTVLNWGWTVRTVTRFFDRITTMPRINLVVDVALFVESVAVMLSGLMVSRVVLTAMGVSATASPIWSAVHAVSAEATSVLLAVHAALHWKWLVRTLAGFGAPRPRASRHLGEPALVPVRQARR